MPATPFHRFALNRCTTAIWMAFALPALAMAQASPEATVAAQAPAATYPFDIPAQAAADALQAFARAMKQQVSFDGAALAGKTSNALMGTYTAEEALHQLLQGTGISFRRGTHGVWIVGPAQPAAQAPAGNEKTLDRVLVTGTRILGATTPSPVISIGAEQIREEGHADMGEVIRSIPQNFSGGQNPGVAMGAGDNIANQNMNSGSALNLRGLGPDATLTLLNGRRLSYSGFVNAVDVSLIPMAALSRIEVIADGASAIYGSDAVAGVANIITRRNFDGLAANYRFGTTSDGGGTERQVSLVGGTTWSTGGILAAYDYAHVDAIFGHQRSYTEYMLDPGSIIPERKHHSALISASQAFGDSVNFGIDVVYTERESRTTAAQPSSKFFSEPKTNIFVISPGLDIALPGEWSLSLGGSYGKDRIRYSTMRLNPAGVYARSSAGCYCNLSMSGELGAEGPLFALPGGEVRVAAGLGYRKNDFESRSFTSGSLTEGSRSSRYGYGEIYFPLVSPEMGVSAVNSLDFTAALRHENYGAMGKVTTPKLGLVYQPSADFTLKASWGKSYKAPNLLQQHQDYIVYLWNTTTLGGTGYPPDATALMVYGGNPELKPERATSWTGSVLFHPEAVPGLEIGLSYFDIDYRDRIVQPVENIAAAFRDPIYDEFVLYGPSLTMQDEIIRPAPGGITNYSSRPYDPNTVMAIVYDNYVNVARQRAKGIDLSGSYGFALAGGKMTLRGSASWLDGQQQNSESQPAFDTSGRIFNPAKFRARAGAVWSGGGWMLSSFVNHVGGVTDNRRVVIEELGSFTTLDLNARYDMSKLGGVFSNLELGLTVQNAFNRAPTTFAPIDNYSVSYDSTNYSAIGRFMSFSVSKRW